MYLRHIRFVIQKNGNILQNLLIYLNLAKNSNSFVMLPIFAYSIH